MKNPEEQFYSIITETDSLLKRGDEVICSNLNGKRVEALFLGFGLNTDSDCWGFTVAIIQVKNKIQLALLETIELKEEKK